ncbi:MAG: hypothetical protein IRY99_27595, partial [Isosphaeraceae bacterium]|nr:hypothetical protein [Isosphaeraceae bacterium]
MGMNPEALIRRGCDPELIRRVMAGAPTVTVELPPAASAPVEAPAAAPEPRPISASARLRPSRRGRQRTYQPAPHGLPGLRAGERLLGLDVSSTRTGYALVRSDGSLILLGQYQPHGVTPAERVAELADAVGRLIGRVRPTRVVFEWAEGVMGRARRLG